MTDLQHTAINYVPEFQKSAPNVQALYKQLGIFLDEIGATITGFKDYSDFANMSEANLEYFVQEKGVTFPRNMSLENRRKLAKDIVNLHRATGTEKSLRFMFNIIGLSVQIQYAWMKETDMIAKPAAPYNFVYGKVTTPQGDGVTIVDSGAYFAGTDTFGAIFNDVSIVGETYTPNKVTGQINGSNTSDRVVKLPYLRIVVTAQDYNTFTQDYLDPETGKIYSYTTTEQFLITQEILNYFLDQARPATVAIIEISTPFQLSDLLPYTFNSGTTSQATSLNDETLTADTVNIGWQIDGTVTLGIPMDRYLLGETFGDFEIGANTMNLYPTPAQVEIDRTYDFRPGLASLITNSAATLRKNTNWTGQKKSFIPYPGATPANFSALIFGATAGPSGAYGFTIASGTHYVAPDQSIPVTTGHIYKMHAQLEPTAASSHVLLGIVCYDTAGNVIQPQNAWRNTAKNTTVYTTAHTGDTTLYIAKNGSGWPNTGNDFIQFNIKSDFSDLPNQQAYQYTAIDTSNSAFDILTLAHPLTVGYVAGTAVGYSQGGDPFVYCASAGTYVVPATGSFTDYYGKAQGTNAATAAPTANQLRFGTVSIAPVMVLDSTGVGSGYSFGCIELIDVTAARLQDYVPTRKQVHVTLTLPVDSSAVLVASKSDRKSLAGCSNVAPVYAALGSLQGKAMVSGTSITFGNSAGHDTISRASGSWVTDGFVLGDQIQVSGTASAGIYKISAVTGSLLTLTANGLVGTETTVSASVVSCLDMPVSGYFAVAVNITEPSVIGAASLAVVQSAS